MARAACVAAALCGMLGVSAACSFASAARRPELRGTNLSLPQGHVFVTSSDTMAALRRIAQRRGQSNSSGSEFEVIREEIRYILEHPDPWNYDDGSWAPIALRLAWHAFASWDPDPPVGEPRGGSQGGATMRFEPGASYLLQGICCRRCKLDRRPTSLFGPLL